MFWSQTQINVQDSEFDTPANVTTKLNICFSVINRSPTTNTAFKKTSSERAQTETFPFVFKNALFKPLKT